MEPQASWSLRIQCTLYVIKNVVHVIVHCQWCVRYVNTYSFVSR